MLLFVTAGCAEKTPVMVQLQDCMTRAPISDVRIEVYPPIRWFPTFPESGGTTDEQGKAVLRLPGESGTRLWSGRFNRAGHRYRFLFDPREGEPETIAITPSEYAPDRLDSARCIRVTYWMENSPEIEMKKP